MNPWGRQYQFWGNPPSRGGLYHGALSNALTSSWTFNAAAKFAQTSRSSEFARNQRITRRICRSATLIPHILIPAIRPMRPMWICRRVVFAPRQHRPSSCLAPTSISVPR